MSRYVPPKAHKAPRRSRRRGFYHGKPCPYCGEIMQHYDGPGNPSIHNAPRCPTVDHVFPESMGGSAKIRVCITCNNRKANKTPTEWLEWVLLNMPHRADAIRAIYTRFRLVWKEPDPTDKRVQGRIAAAQFRTTERTSP